jgi:predicted CXXCH cytochrome family protein
MKKLLVLTAALALISTSALAASIVGTAHDLSGAGVVVGGDSTELCAYCHTPHNAASGAVGTPLMMRGTAGNVASVCFSCHDGTDISAKGGASTANAGDVNAGAMFGTLAAYNLDVAAKTMHPVEIAVPAVAANFKAIFHGTTVSCSSCHDVHDNAFTPFLKGTNANSAICLACHEK